MVDWPNPYVPRQARSCRGGAPEVKRGSCSPAPPMQMMYDRGGLLKARETLQRLRQGATAEWTWEELETYLRFFKRRRDGTIKTRLRHLRYMNERAAPPVQVRGPHDEIVDSFCAYVAHRELVDRVPAPSLVNDHKAIRVLGDFLGIPREAWPTAPMLPAHDDRPIPSPLMVSELLHANYLPGAKRSYENALVRYLLAFDFGIGLRFPSEPHALTLDDVDLDLGVLTITEPKKNDRRRRIFIEPTWMNDSLAHLSVKNWLRWRRKIDSPSRALFVQKDGKPFATKESLTNFLNRRVRPRFPWFYPYLGRHWSVNARLIEWDFDYARVATWHGHDSVNMTKNSYERSARVLQAVHGDEWLKRAFKPNRPKPRHEDESETPADLMASSR